MKKFISALLIFLIISVIFVFAAYSSEFFNTETAPEIQANAPYASPLSAPATGDIGIVIAFAVCGATAFVTIKLTGNKNKIK